MAEVRSINGDEFGTPGKPDADLVEMLEVALAEARGGHMVGAAMVLSNGNGYSGFRYAGMMKIYEMVGTLEALKKSLLA